MVCSPLVSTGFPSNPYSAAECYFLFLRLLIIILDFLLEAVVILSRDSSNSHSMERCLTKMAYKGVFMVSGQSLA